MSLVPSEIDLAADIAAGKGITLVELARQHRTNPSTTFRWVLRGLPRGDGTRVRLAAIKRGRKWLTTAAAVSRFFAALPQSEQAPAAPPIRTPRKRERDCDRAKQALNKKYGF
jgi:hypothetical protein